MTLSFYTFVPMWIRPGVDILEIPIQGFACFLLLFTRLVCLLLPLLLVFSVRIDFVCQ